MLSNDTYGSPRMKHELRDNGLSVEVMSPDVV